jgi:hypothetical protein
MNKHMHKRNSAQEAKDRSEPKVQQKKGGVSKKGTQAGKKNNTQVPQEQEK